MTTFDTLLSEIRPALLRSAGNRLRNPHWAEDAVSETLLAALQRRPDFHTDPGRVRAWLFGILRHKVADQLRLHLGDAGAPAPYALDEDLPDEIGDPCPHADPMHRVAEAQFIRALHGQLERLPQAHARAFVLRDCLGIDTADICEELAVTAGNLWVMLHRTRHRLRQSLWAHHA
jgi:RNA polymerase sigma factor (sigma-70 family)